MKIHPQQTMTRCSRSCFDLSAKVNNFQTLMVSPPKAGYQILTPRVWYNSGNWGGTDALCRRNIKIFGGTGTIHRGNKIYILHDIPYVFFCISQSYQRVKVYYLCLSNCWWPVLQKLINYADRRIRWVVRNRSTQGSNCQQQKYLSKWKVIIKLLWKGVESVTF